MAKVKQRSAQTAACAVNIVNEQYHSTNSL